jgi:hypothetical protein
MSGDTPEPPRERLRTEKRSRRTAASAEASSGLLSSAAKSSGAWTKAGDERPDAAGVRAGVAAVGCEAIR